jgi:hypothetical protein
MRDLSLNRAIVLGTIATALLAGCTGGVEHDQGPTPGSSTAPTGTASPMASSSPVISNPFTITARFSPESLGLEDPANLAIGPDGNLYIPDASQHVTVVSPEGKVLRRWGRPGKGPGEFSFDVRGAGFPGVVASIAVGSDGMVYVLDSGNRRIEAFSSTGGFIRQFDGSGTEMGRFLGPQDFSTGLTIDSGGNVYVVDPACGALCKFSADGALAWRVGGPGFADEDLVGHIELSSSSVDVHGRILLTNDDRGRVVFVDPGGHKVDAFGEGSGGGASGTFREGSCDVTVDVTGDIFVNSCQEKLVPPHYTEVFDRTHRLVGVWYPSPFGWSPRFGPHGEVFTLADDGSILRLKVTLRSA